MKGIEKYLTMQVPAGMKIVVDLFAGPGGWDEGLRQAGYNGPLIGLENDEAACETARAAGHDRLCVDIAIEPTLPYVGRVDGMVMSPPCQAWSSAGKKAGEKDRAKCHELADRMAVGDDSIDFHPWEDPRSPLVCQPVRWVRDVRPRWVALEEVPAVASLWEHFARIFRTWGYSVWTGDLRADAFGVPQTRTRRILIARNDGGAARPPEPTHTQWPARPEPDLFDGPTLQKFRVMADVIVPRPAGTTMYAAGITGQSRPRDPLRSPSATITAKGNAVWHLAGITHSVSPADAAALQSFRPDFPWTGDRTRQWEQIGNAIPPRLAAAIVGELFDPEPDIRFRVRLYDSEWNVVHEEIETYPGQFKDRISGDPDTGITTYHMNIEVGEAIT